MFITDFANDKQLAYSIYNNYRSLGHLIDGQKPSSRKLIYTCSKLTKFDKVDTIANKTAGDTQYLHGSVNLEGVLKGMNNDYSGTNIIPLFEKEGFFGTRTETNCGASRYVKSRLSTITSNIILKEDYDVLIEQEFEGYKIEPKYYVPIIPLIFVNGSEGIGNGFSHRITTRNPVEIIKYLFDELDGKETSTLMPYYNDFKGTITRDNQNHLKYYIQGCLEVKNTTTIIIDELPVGYTLPKYISILEDLEDKKIIKEYTDKSNKNKFYFEVKVSRELTSNSIEKLYDIFKLNTSSTENLTVIDENNMIREFDNVRDMMNHYIKIRLEYYVKRKEYLINKMKLDITILENRIKFINDILNDVIIFKGKKKTQIEKQLKDLNYYKDESYDYLLNMNIHSLTEDKISDLENRLSKLIQELEEYLNKDVTMIWKEELNNLLVALGEKKLRVNQSRLEDIIKPIDNINLEEIQKIEKFKQEISNELAIPKTLLFNSDEGLSKIKSEDIKLDDLF